MRPIPTTLAALLLAFAAGPALAQTNQTDLNAANASMMRQNQLRSIQQDMNAQTNANRLDIQRNQISQPPVNTAPVIVPRR